VLEPRSAVERQPANCGLVAVDRVIWNISVLLVGVAPDSKDTAALARCVPELRRAQLIVNVNRPLESGEDTVLTFLPST
jgi:hypothetical protein